MNTTLKTAEKFAAQTLTEDGLIDIFTGIGFMIIGYFWLVDNSAVSVVMPFALIGLWKTSRRYISEPRIGRVTLAKETKATIKTGRTILAVIALTLVVGVIAYLLGGAGDIQGTAYYPLFAAGPSLLAATLIFFHAKHLKCPRYYAYAAWLVAAAGIAIWLGEGPAKAFMLGGVPILLGGFWYLIKFLSSHPKAVS